ncbi:MAG: CoA synthetase [Candidatus Rokubacteria bacterium]|nr:CoA synthetase [Candidatus Rokubacteria bacterium]
MTRGAPGASRGDYTPDELMATIIAREVRDGEVVGVGTLAPVPASGVLLAHFSRAPRARVIILNHPEYWPFRNGSKEFYDFAQRGGLDLFFLSGGQIDRRGNLNLIAVGDADRPRVRFPGGAGAAMLYYFARRVIVFRKEHSPKVFVERVDHVASPGSTPPDVLRPGGPWKVVTPLCVFRFDRQTAALVVESLHPGVTREDLQRQTGFTLAYEPAVRTTSEPTADELDLLRTRVRDAIAKTYPRYAETAFVG